MNFKFEKGKTQKMVLPFYSIRQSNDLSCKTLDLSVMDSFV